MRRRRRAGLTLPEVLVVLMIGLVLCFSLLPLAVGLLRQERKLDAPALAPESLPLLWERLGRDLSLSRSGTVAPDFDDPSFRIELLPRAAADPEISWEFRADVAVRHVARQGTEGRVFGFEQTWKLPGTVRLVRDELLRGRWVFRFQPREGEAEILAFLPGRPTEKTP